MNNNLSTPEALSTSQVTTSSQGYNGYFKLEDGILSFTGCSVQLRNISQISNYPVRPINYINGRMIFWACLLFIGSLAYSKGLNRYDSDDKTIAYTLAVCSAGIILYGIIERLRPDNYAITIELSSGFRHYFVHKSKVFIDETYKAFVIAIQQNRSFLAVFNNTTNTISIGDGSIVGDIHGNTQGNSNTGLASSINHFNSGSGNVVGNVEGNTQQNGNIAAQRGNSSNTMNLGSNNVLGNVGGNRQTNG